MPAGFWVRLGAMLLDALIVGIPLTILSLILTGGDGRDWVTDLLSSLYGILLPVLWYGYTLGKRICGIRIRKVDTGEPPTIITMLLRVIVGGIVYGLTLGIGVIVSIAMIAAREDKRCLHDFIAGTEVVHD